MSSSSAIATLAESLLTPGLFARTTSHQRWKWARHLELIDQSLVDIAAGRIDRLMVCMPPRHGKSELISKHFPAWYLGVNPNHRVIMCGYSTEFAKEWGRYVRELIEEWGPVLFDGLTTADDSAAANSWKLAGWDGGMISAGIGGGITGHGANLLIVDDPIKNDEEAASETTRERHWNWWTSTALTRLEPGGAVVMVMTRWHPDDLAGRILATESNRWRVLRMPAIAEENEYGPDGALIRHEGDALWPERYRLQDLIKIRDSQPRSWWLSLYQQTPTKSDRSEWPDDWFGPDVWFDEWPDPKDLNFKVVSLDPSKGKTDKSDFSAFVRLALANDGVMYVEADLDRMNPQRVVDHGTDIAVLFGPQAFVIEVNQFQEIFADLFSQASKARGMMLPIVPVTNTMNKHVRILGTLTPYLARREIRFKSNSRGTKALVDQLRWFPQGVNDDGPDALEMAVRHVRDMWLATQQEAA